MNSNTATGSSWFPRRRRPRPFEDLCLLAEPVDLAPQPRELGALLTGQAVLADPLVQLGLLEPVAQRLPPETPSSRLSSSGWRPARRVRTASARSPGGWGGRVLPPMADLLGEFQSQNRPVSTEAVKVNPLIGGGQGCDGQPGSRKGRPAPIIVLPTG